ncbi:MAG TPA: hypothetical protein VMG30_02745 [Acidobacteriota bacterium]|nr:hypothetical protein [Acidobacteriota bacterium]
MSKTEYVFTIYIKTTQEELWKAITKSDMATQICSGWPRVLSSMKSYLETGKALDTWAGHEKDFAE